MRLNNLQEFIFSAALIRVNHNSKGGQKKSKNKALM